jgi:hypothetical protein
LKDVIEIGKTKKKNQRRGKKTIPINSVFEKRGILNTILNKSNIERCN